MKKQGAVPSIADANLLGRQARMSASGTKRKLAARGNLLSARAI
jgi:hypothetical protein